MLINLIPYGVHTYTRSVLYLLPISQQHNSMEKMKYQKILMHPCIETLPWESLTRNGL